MSDFAKLDALLDEVLQLEEPDRQAFLDRLTGAQRAQVVALLGRVHSTQLEDIAQAARRSVLPLDEPATSDSAAGRWRLKRELGSGGMGQVFYAVRDEDDYAQRAAVKILWSHRADADFKARFFRERRILASLDHPGLARFLDGGLLADGRPWFAMEFVDGVDVASFAKQLPLARRLELFLTICEPAQYAHDRLIVHRDIKPHNILVDETGRPRLLDFGVATILGNLKDDVRTQAGGSPLTLQYASPEQVSGSLITVGSDVYQLGLLLYQMLAGKPPYRLNDRSLQEAIRIICDDRVRPPSRFAPGLSKDLDAIVLHALNKDPAERYHSVSSFADDVRRYLSGHPVVARPRSRWYVARRFVQRNAVVVSVAVLVAFALTGATAVSVRMADEAQAEAQRSQKTQQILADVFRQADPYGGAGGDVTLADALVAAESSIQEQIRGDHRLAWDVNNTLGEIFSSLGLFDEETAAFAAALAAARELGGNNEREVMIAVAGLGNTFVRENPARAVEFFSEELPDAPASRSAAQAWLSAKYAQVNALTRLRDFERADIAIAQMAAAAERFGVEAPRTRGRLSQLLAGRANRAGDLAGADQHWRDAVAHMREAGNPFALAVILSNRGIFLGRNGRYDESDAVFRQSLAVFDEHSPNDPTHASVLRTYAGLLHRMGQTDASIERLNEALAILDGIDEHYTRYVVLVNLATYTMIAGRIDESLPATIDGMSLALAEFGADSPITRRMLSVFARVLLLGGKHGRALALLAHGAHAEDADDARHLAVAEAALDVNDLNLAAASLERVAETGAAASQRVRMRLSCALDDRTSLNRLLADSRVAGDGAGNDLASNEAKHRSIWAALSGAALSIAAGEPPDAPLIRAIASYRASQHVFLDTLDHWRILRALQRLTSAAGSSMPDDLRARIETLSDTAAKTRRLLDTVFAAEVASLFAAFPGESQAHGGDRELTVMNSAASFCEPLLR